MLSSAASFLAIGAGLLGQAQSTEATTWQLVRQSVAYLYHGNQPIGVAALIDDSGLFLTHMSLVQGIQTLAKFEDGSLPMSMLLIASDEHTQLALLRPSYWEMGRRRPIAISKSALERGAPVTVATAQGPIRGEFVSDSRVGVMRPSLRYMPLSEIRFESSAGKIGGSMVFASNGELIAVLGATLTKSQRALESQQEQSLSDIRSGFAPAKFGPKGLTVGYAISQDVLRRVVVGFKSPMRRVQHPTIGIFFKASTSGRGVLLVSVMPGSPAGLAGLLAGDVVLDVNGTSVNDPVELASILFSKSIGDTITIRYMRGLTKTSVNVMLVGGQVSLGLTPIGSQFPLGR